MSPLRGTPPLVRLLRAAATDDHALRLASLPAAHVRRAVDLGLGPWLRRCTAGDPGATASPLWPLVQGSDLTARVIVGEQMDALDEILDAWGADAAPLTLLKGIAVAGQYYPEPHLRLMGDLDLLADPASAAALQSRLIDLGYRPGSEAAPAFYDTHHHLSPLHHPRRRVWVEVHRGLFPAGGSLGGDTVFDEATVRAERRPAEHRGRRVDRLSDELQLVYLAAHWTSGFRPTRGLPGVLDVTRLLAAGPRLRWDRILAWLDGSPAAAASLYLLLAYLVRHRLADVEAPVLRAVHARQRAFGRVNLALLHAALDRYLLGPRPSDRVMTARNFEIVWTTVLASTRRRPGLLRVAWKLLPSRAWLLGRG